jgi:hypothetical protein
MKRLCLGHFPLSACAIYTEIFKKFVELVKWLHPIAERTHIPAIVDPGRASNEGSENFINN